MEALAAILWGGAKQSFLEWGRRTGKSECEIAAVGIWSQLVQHSKSYYFVPEVGQAAEILWKPKKIEMVVPGNWIEEMLNNEMRVYWAGSTERSAFFKLDGANNIDKRRGIEPSNGILIIDEVRDIHPEFWSVMRPILAKWYSPVIFSTTPPNELTDSDDPTKPHWVIRMADGMKDHPKRFYSHATIHDNPHLSAEFIEDTRLELIEKGEEDVWQREYLAMRVPKKTGRKFPMLNRTTHVRPHAALVELITPDLDYFEWWCLTDPAAGKDSCWAWNLIGVNKFSRMVYFLDELDTSDQGQMMTSVQWPLILSKLREWEPDLDEWSLHYDEAEAWFATDMMDKYDVAFAPSKKESRSKYEGFSSIKDLLLSNQALFSDRCKHTLWELENYEGEKSRDHHVDLSRYFFNVSGYTVKTEKPPAKKAVLDRMERTKLKQVRESEDWTSGLV